MSSLEQLCSTSYTVFDHIFKHFEVRQIFSAARRIFKGAQSRLNGLKS